MTTLLTISAKPKEVEALIDTLDDASLGVTEEPFEEHKNDYEFKGKFRVDTRNAKPEYRFGALHYGPIKAELVVDYFVVYIDWHKKLGIPKKHCIKLKDPCGNTLIDVCWTWDFGVSHFVLLKNQTLTNIVDVPVLDLAFRDKPKNKDYFELTGDIPLLGALVEVLLSGFIKGAVSQVETFVKKLLSNVLGGGEIAKLFIDFLIGAIRIVAKALDFVTDIVRLAFQPIDELLHKVFDEKIEITLQEEGFPKKLVLIDSQKNPPRPEVPIQISKPPKIDLNTGGLKIEVWE
jgi:hypothetical protein